jgi:hypothetical protein
MVYDSKGKIVRDKDGNPVMKFPKGDTALAIFLLKTMFRFKEPDQTVKLTAGNKGSSELVFNIGGTTTKREEIMQHLLEFYDKK